MSSRRGPTINNCSMIENRWERAEAVITARNGDLGVRSSEKMGWNINCVKQRTGTAATSVGVMKSYDDDVCKLVKVLANIDHDG